MKKVPSCELLNSMKANALGTENITNAVVACEVEKEICPNAGKDICLINTMALPCEIIIQGGRCVHSRDQRLSW